jgi:hypothetical protein
MPPLSTTTGLAAARAAPSASTNPSGSDRPSAYTAITRVPSSSTSARMKSARPSAASLPQLAVTRKPNPNSSARACAITAMPPLWLTIETTPGIIRLRSVSMDVNDAVSPFAVLRMPTQLGPQRRKPVSLQYAASEACLATPSPPTSAKPAAHATPAGTPAATHSFTASSTLSPGTARTARSGTPGRSRKLG